MNRNPNPVLASILFCFILMLRPETRRGLLTVSDAGTRFFIMIVHKNVILLWDDLIGRLYGSGLMRFVRYNCGIRFLRNCVLDVFLYFFCFVLFVFKRT